MDVVIPLGPNDVEVVQQSTAYALKNVVGIRHMYIVTQHDLKHAVPTGCTFVDEAMYLFTINDVQSILNNGDRAGWYYQQLLKLYAHTVISGLSEQHLILDADLHVMRPICFLSQDHKALLAVSTEHNQPYFDHMQKLLPSVHRVRDCSGIVHHMVFDACVLHDLFSRVALLHSKPFWQAFIDTVNPVDFSGASEYELYFNFALLFHPDKVSVRPLKLRNVAELTHNTDDDLVAVHHYMRSPP